MCLRRWTGCRQGPLAEVKEGKVSTHWTPFFRPGYTQRWVNDITAIDAEMIVLEK